MFKSPESVRTYVSSKQISRLPSAKLYPKSLKETKYVKKNYFNPDDDEEDLEDDELAGIEEVEGEADDLEVDDPDEDVFAKEENFEEDEDDEDDAY